MTYRRKTCEYCKQRLKPDDENSCAACHAEMVAAYNQAIVEFEKLISRGLSAEQAAEQLLDDILSNHR
jgi:RNA polymerase subunit RPABC4/transcription elongation factor Spt4